MGNDTSDLHSNDHVATAEVLASGQTHKESTGSAISSTAPSNGLSLVTETSRAGKDITPSRTPCDSAWEMAGLSHSPRLAEISYSLSPSENSQDTTHNLPSPEGSMHFGAAEEDQVLHSAADMRPDVLWSIGRSNLAVLFGGSILILVALGYLILLWAGEGPAGGEQAPRLWRAIMLNGWATQSVTLTSLLMRIVSAAQASLCTSFVAALLVERRRVPLSQVIRLSITRSVNGGPRELLQAIMSSRMRVLAFNRDVILLSVLFLIVMGIQFSSTILISDFGTTRLIQYPNRTLINLALSATADAAIGSFLTVGDLDSTMVLFGELESSSDPTPDDSGVSDTGIKRRAFLPFQKEDRISLQYFEGAALMLNTRVSCARPSMLAALVWDARGFPALAGGIRYNQTFENAGLNTTDICQTSPQDTTYCLPETFNCSLPFSTIETILDRPAALCHLPIHGLAEETQHTMPAWDKITDPLNFASGSWPGLVFMSNIPKSYWKQLSKSVPFELGPPIPHGEWNSYEIEPGISLNVTLCFSGLNTTLSKVAMTGNISQGEPDIRWNTTTYSYEVDALRTLFGAGPVHKSVNERGLLSIVGEIQDPAPLSSLDVNSTMAGDAIFRSEQQLGNGVAADVWSSSGFNSSIGMCDHCSLLDQGVSSDIATLFQDIVQTSGRAAVAVDAYLTMLSRSWYYSFQPKFDVPGYVDVAFSAEILLPRYWGGITAVVVLVVANLVLTWTISVLYVRHSRHTVAGDFWHAASQLVSDETMPIFEQSNRLKDRDVVNLLKRDGDFLVRIGRPPSGGGNVSVVRCEDQSDSTSGKLSEKLKRLHVHLPTWIKGGWK